MMGLGAGAAATAVVWSCSSGIGGGASLVAPPTVVIAPSGP